MRKLSGLRLGVIWVMMSILMLSLYACGDRPSNVLSEDKMVDLLVDMELAEAYANTGNSLSRINKMELGKRVMKAHGVSEETLDTTLAWYGRNVDEYAALFEKVDKEILRRRKKYTEVPGMQPTQSENLWPFAEHLVVSPLSGSEMISFSVPNPAVKSGDVLEWTFSLPNPTGVKTTIGVEYEDGYGEGIVNMSNNKKSVSVTLYTDTARKVSRLFGSLISKDKNSIPLYIDSLKIMVQPFDSVNYRSQKRSQKSFGPYKVVTIPKTVEKTDSLKESSDSISVSGPPAGVSTDSTTTPAHPSAPPAAIPSQPASKNTDNLNTPRPAKSPLRTNLNSPGGEGKHNKPEDARQRTVPSR